VAFDQPRPSRRGLFIGLGVVALLASALAIRSLLTPAEVAVVPPVPPAAAQPRLSVDSRPAGARVQLDSDGRGQTPLELELAPGTHELAFSLPGYAPEKRQVSLKLAEHLNLIVDLEKLAAPVAETVDAGHKPEVKAVAKTGKLTIDTTPWTSVYLGNRKLGDTPLVQYPLPAGRQVLRLVNPEQNLSSTIEVDIAANDVTVKKLVLQ
jgi:hypothetical protein